jgi:hypothetical protein
VAQPPQVIVSVDGKEARERMADPIATSISLAALAVSGVTGWLTLFRRGTVRITKPTVIFFGPDGGPPEGISRPKVFLRSLIYSTGKRGHIIEGMYVALRRGETRQTFNIWAYGDERLVRGSGLFVGESGVACNHHFLLPEDGTPFRFLAGDYDLDVFASVVGWKTLHLASVSVSLTDKAATELQDPQCGIFFDWGPDAGRYHSHVDQRKPPRAPRFSTGEPSS